MGGISIPKISKSDFSGVGSGLMDLFNQAVDLPAEKSPLSKYIGSGGRRWLRRGMASAFAGPIGFQYQYSREKGMSDKEAAKNALTGGLQYSDARNSQMVREASDQAEVQRQEFEKRRVAEETRARGQIAARVRRSGRSDRPNTKNGTLLNGSLGIPGEVYGSFAQLLGLYDGRV